nr:PREDICTED: LRR receptor-like serine/threonine-protein kinase ERECTA isoform X3 [Nicotiana sylvestris]
MSKMEYWWLLIILFLANGQWCCLGCWKEERSALLQLKANINYIGSGGFLSSWMANETSDCCRWLGVVCSNSTRRITELSITVSEKDMNDTLPLFNASLFLPFRDIRALLLPGNSFVGWADTEGFEKLKQLRKLEKLDLSGNLFNRSIFLSLSQLSSLKSLNLKDYNIGSGFERLSGLNKLEILDLSDNTLNDENVLSALGKLIITLEKPSLI